MSASRETISQPQLRWCRDKKRLRLQSKSYQYNQQVVLRISFSNSTFLSKGIKKACSGVTACAVYMVLPNALCVVFR